MGYSKDVFEDKDEVRLSIKCGWADAVQKTKATYSSKMKTEKPGLYINQGEKLSW